MLLLASLLLLAWLGNDINFAWSTGTQSRALYVDEGFYADGAQNLVKTGHWDIELDSRHWPGSPLTLFLQGIVFSLFGASVTVARILSVLIGLLGLWALYSIAKTRFSPAVSALLVLSSIAPLPYITAARSAITDPTAMTMSLLAMWVFCSMQKKHYAIPLSLFFAFLAFFSKMYYLFALASLITVWLGELLVVPRIQGRAIDRRMLGVLILSLGAIALFYLGYRLAFSTEIANYMAINANKKPKLDLLHLANNIRLSFFYLPLNTRTQTFFNVLTIAVSYAIFHFVAMRLLYKDKAAPLVATLGRIKRADWVMGAFLVSGLVTVGTLELHKAHYHFFAILPFAFVSVGALYQQIPGKWAAYISAAVLIVHFTAQELYYTDWLSREHNTSIAEASADMIKRIYAESPGEELIPVIGEYSAQLGLFGDRIISIDAKWISQEELCERVSYWKPRYHVNVVWPKSGTRKYLKRIVKCPGVKNRKRIKRYHTFLEDYLILTRINYEK